MVISKIQSFNFFYPKVLSNIQKITCIILRNLFGLYLFSHQSCATGTLLLRKQIYPRKYSLNLRQLNFFMLLRSCFELFEMFFEVNNLHFLPASSVRQHRYLPWKKRSKLKFFTLKPSNKQFKTASKINLNIVPGHSPRTKRGEYASRECGAGLRADAEWPFGSVKGE